MYEWQVIEPPVCVLKIEHENLCGAVLCAKIFFVNHTAIFMVCVNWIIVPEFITTDFSCVHKLRRHILLYNPFTPKKHFPFIRSPVPLHLQSSVSCFRNIQFKQFLSIENHIKKKILSLYLNRKMMIFLPDVQDACACDLQLSQYLVFVILQTWILVQHAL